MSEIEKDLTLDQLSFAQLDSLRDRVNARIEYLIELGKVPMLRVCSTDLVFAYFMLDELDAALDCFNKCVRKNIHVEEMIYIEKINVFKHEVDECLRLTKACGYER